MKPHLRRQHEAINPLHPVVELGGDCNLLRWGRGCPGGGGGWPPARLGGWSARSGVCPLLVAGATAYDGYRGHPKGSGGAGATPPSNLMTFWR